MICVFWEARGESVLDFRVGCFREFFERDGELTVDGEYDYDLG